MVPSDQSDEVSFGRWQVTDALPKSLMATYSVIEIRLTPSTLVLIDAGGQPLGSWPIGRVEMDVAHGKTNRYLRLEADRLWIRPIEQQPAGDLREAIVARQPAHPPAAPTAAAAGVGAGRWLLGLGLGLAIWAVVWFFDFWLAFAAGLSFGDASQPIPASWWLLIYVVFIGGPVLGIVVGLAIGRGKRRG